MAYSDVLKTLSRSSYLGFTTRNFSLVSSQISNDTAKWMQVVNPRFSLFFLIHFLLKFMED
ncbi:hypothetical protein Goklo_001452 [Gossypium klotzschianum]|uniref:Uncharacterized protein n=1 Tax=Gossypium klotzschianum TaxID=34286 RepID=A0A7J8W0I6_9ROSI|nr:hypothetical protein [Gossypium klotzschianum]